MLVRNKLPRRYCLKSRLEISQLLRTGKKLSGACFYLVWQESDSFRYAILVSRKFGNAVQRNRVKRLFREAIRLNRKLLEKTVKIAVFPAPASDKQSFELLDAEISRLFSAINRKT